MIKTLCVNDSNMPESLEPELRVKKGKEYTVVAVYNRVQPGANLGLILLELDLEESNGPYSCFQVNRFRFKQKDIPELIELIKACDGLQDFDPVELIEEEVLTEEEIF